MKIECMIVEQNSWPVSGHSMLSFFQLRPAQMPFKIACLGLKEHILYTEANVLCTSSLYPLHLVHVAISELLGTGTLGCRGELSATGGCRTDIGWVYRYDIQFISIAVLEFKNKNVRRWVDFSRAIANQKNAKQKRRPVYSYAT